MSRQGYTGIVLVCLLCWRQPRSSLLSSHLWILTTLARSPRHTLVLCHNKRGSSHRDLDLGPGWGRVTPHETCWQRWHDAIGRVGKEQQHPTQTGRHACAHEMVVEWIQIWARWKIKESGRVGRRKPVSERFACRKLIADPCIPRGH